MAQTFTVVFKYDDGEDSYYYGETADSARGLINNSALTDDANAKGLMEVTITPEH